MGIGIWAFDPHPSLDNVERTDFRHMRVFQPATSRWRRSIPFSRHVADPSHKRTTSTDLSHHHTPDSNLPTTGPGDVSATGRKLSSRG